MKGINPRRLKLTGVKRDYPIEVKFNRIRLFLMGPIKEKSVITF